MHVWYCSIYRAHLIEVLASISHSTGHAETLAQGTSCHIDKVQPGCRVTLQIRIDFPQVHQIVNGEETSLSPSSIENRRRMTFRQDEPKKPQKLGKSKKKDISLLGVHQVPIT